MKQLCVALLSLILINLAWSQPLSQTIKGTVVDLDTQTPLIGATVIVRGTDPLKGATTDIEGYFWINSVPIGRYDIQANYMGYEPNTIPEIVVSSAKEVILNIQLEETVLESEQVVVESSIQKEKPQNSMAVVSGRSFTVEEARRYAGGIDDPARLASAFAGVTVGAPQDNAIVVRGNSPKGLLWQIEGVKVPNPNHFPDINVAGGGFVSILSSQVLSNSDFYTGAFPAEYGNALAGVFDVSIREGNSEEREYTLQAGVLGLDVAAEGPLALGKGGSFLFNYRFATMALIADLLPSEQIPQYSDLAFKITVPTNKYGKFSFWGLGAKDLNEEYEEPDSSLWNTAWDRMAYDLEIDMGALGLSHKYLLGQKSYLRSSLVRTEFDSRMHMKRLDDSLILQDNLIMNNRSGTISFSSYINTKFNASHTNRSGFIVNRLDYRLDQQAALDNQLPLTRLVHEHDASSLLQFYSQSKLNLGKQIILNFGFHSQTFALTHETSFEPRLGLTWNMSPIQSLSLGYGNHSQLEELRVYFIEQNIAGEITRPNQALELSRAHHLVLAYQQRLTHNLRLKIEPYYQEAYNVPIIPDSSYSMLNFKQDLTFHSALSNEGTGVNYGVDITLERFLENNMYYLITASLFDSKYVGGDNVERVTGYASGYVVNGLWGKEYYLGKTRENVFGANLKLTAAGGVPLSPANLARTRELRQLILDETRAFEERAPSQIFLDISLIYTKNKANYSSTWALQLKNALGAKSLYYYDYDYREDEVFAVEEAIVVPSLSYKIEF